MYKKLLIAILIFHSLGVAAQTRKIATNQPLFIATKQLAWWFKYWTPSDAKAPLVSLIIQRQVCGIADAETYLETVATDLKSRQIVFQAFYDLTRGDRDYLFLNLKNLGLTAVNARVITDYIIANYPIKQEAPVLTNKEKQEQERAEALKIKEQKTLDTILSKNYDLINYQNLYEQFYSKLKSAVKGRIDNNYVKDFPSMGTIDQQFKKVVFNSILFPDYKSVKEFSKSFKGYYEYKVVYNYHLVENYPGMNEEETQENAELLEGPESDKLFEQLHLQLPIIEIPVKFQALYELKKVDAQHESAFFKDLSIDMVRGITVVNIKKGKISYLRFPPLPKLESLIADKIESKPNGKYIVKYEFGNFLNDGINSIVVDEVK
ncbi:MAG TPA: hypothetical protein VIM89_05570 [Mucilaginibacter sp.]